MSQDDYVKELGGVGLLVSSEDELKTAHSFVMPTSVIDLNQTQQIYKYIDSTKLVSIVSSLLRFLCILFLL